MNPSEKLTYFKYVLRRLLEWHSSFHPNEDKNDISILKALKLLFFVSSAAGNKEHNILLENVFNNYVAMPYGHVESDVYNMIKQKNGELDDFTINNVKTSTINDLNYDDLNHDIVQIIDKAIETLKVINNQLVLLSQFDLVNLSHAWYSWQKYYTMATEHGLRSMPIPYNEIVTEDKVYSLKSF